MRRKQLWLRSIAAVVLVAFVSFCLQPLAIAANLPSAPAPREPTNEEKLSRTIETIENRLEKLEARLEKSEDASKEKSELTTLRQELHALDAQALKDFDAIETHLKDKKLPQVILDRHYQALNAYKQEMQTLKANLSDIEASGDDSDRKVKAKKAREHLKAKRVKRGPKTKFDPNDLPNKSLKPNPNNKPKRTRADFVRAGLIDNPSIQLAAHGTFRIDRLASANDPAYLAATAEVVLTDAIRAKAAELEHHPVKIYNWVRNNVEWIPTWGATQDAEVTLGSRRGNAFDISSLLIALYRASDIPARYVHGTIEVPADKFMNWAGGFTSITAAADYAASGGIPVTTLTGGGRITKVQLEHIWVEAAIDYLPSWGAVNQSADSWIQLDASFKQYQDLPGLDVVAISGLDPNALAQSFAASGTVNQQEGWVSGLNPTILQNAQTQAQTALTNYVNTNLPNPTVGDVIGGRRILAQTSSVLPAALPNRTTVIGARYGILPAGLQNSMTLAFGTDPIGDPINPVTFPWPRLNNHKVTLSFKPATPADEQTLASLLPPGPITDPSQLPSSIPAYLITVIPELAVDGQVAGQGNAMRLGEDLNFFFGISRVGGVGNQTYTYALAAGSYVSVAVAGGSVSPAKLQVLRAKLRQTQTTLQSSNTTAIGALTREDILGDMFHAATFGYFGQYIALSNVASLSQGIRHNLPAGFGTIGYEPNVQTFFGLPRAVLPGGVAADMRLRWVTEVLDGNLGKRRNFNFQSGLLSSALEHGVPERMFSTTQQSIQGVSAVKALRLAGQQGQRIYHISPANQTQVLPNLRLDGAALSEITQALAVGKEVIAHTDRISVPGWTGEGYILFDPVTGDGAYKITGGNNGGYLAIFTIIILTVVLLAVAVSLGGFIGVLLAAWALYNFLDFVDDLRDISDPAEFNRLVFLTIVSQLASLIPIAALGAEGVSLVVFLEAFLFTWGEAWFG